jgi:hypothetical protein
MSMTKASAVLGRWIGQAINKKFNLPQERPPVTFRERAIAIIIGTLAAITVALIGLRYGAKNDLFFAIGSAWIVGMIIAVGIARNQHNVGPKD